MKRFDRLFFAGQVALDIIAINIGFILAYWARYDLQLGREVLVQNTVPISNYLPIQMALTVILLIVFTFKGLYRLSRRANWVDELSIIASSVTIAMAVLIGVVFFYRPVFYSRLIFGFAWVSVIILLAVTRYLVRRLKIAYWQRGIGVSRVLVVGAGAAGQRLMQGLMERPEWGYQLAGFIHDVNPPEIASLPSQNRIGSVCRWLGGIENLKAIIQEQRVDEVFIALPASDREVNQDVVEVCRALGVKFRLVPHLFEMSFNEVAVDEVNGIPMLGMKETSIKGWNLAMKRALDVFLSSVALVVLSPVALIISLAIKIDSKGPIFFRQVRVGKNGAQFMAYKFRSMCLDAEQLLDQVKDLNERDDMHIKIKNDPRITRVGRVLRRSSLDELPQLLNILVGEMSWVGPRPPIPAEVEKYDDWHKKRLEVTPGLTGLWQVSGRADLSTEEMVRLDLYYAENWTLWMDLKILLRTIPAVLSGRGAY